MGAVSPSEFKTIVEPLIGLSVSRPWRGHGAALFMELGPLTGTYPGSGRPKADAGVAFDWCWRVESYGAVAFGSSSGDRKIDHGILSLEGAFIECITIVGRLPELSVQLSDGRWIQSFAAAEGQPGWSLFLNDQTWLGVNRGVVYRGTKTK